MGGVPMSVGDGLSWAWSKFKDNALILTVGIGLWTILSRAGFDAHFTVGDQEYGFSTGIPCCWTVCTHCDRKHFAQGGIWSAFGVE